MNPIALARMGLMGLGRFGPWLGRGTGWGKKAAKGVEKVVRKAQPKYDARYTPVRPLKEPVVNPYNPDLVRRYGRTSKDRFRGVPGVTTGGTRGAPTLGYPAQPAVTKTLPAGFARRHPVWTGIAGTGAALGATTGIYGALGGEEEVVRTQLPQPKAPWAAPEDLLSFSEQAKADAEKGKSDMKKMLKYGFLIAAAGGDPSKFFERASEVGKMTAAYTKDERYAKQYDAVFRKGDMPDTPQVAYRRLTDVGMGPKEAMEITGQVAQLMGKTETERALNNLRNVLASQGEEAAASLLMMYWSTGQLEGAPEYAKEDELRQAALAAVRGGGLGATEPTGEEIGEITLG